MSQPDVDAIRARCEAATPGRWYVDECDGEAMVATVLADKPSPIACASWVSNREVEGLRPVDADFIAHARQDVPALLDALEHLQREKGASHGWHAHHARPDAMCVYCVQAALEAAQRERDAWAMLPPGAYGDMRDLAQQSAMMRQELGESRAKRDDLEVAVRGLRARAERAEAALADLEHLNAHRYGPSIGHDYHLRYCDRPQAHDDDWRAERDAALAEQEVGK